MAAHGEHIDYSREPLTLEPRVANRLIGPAVAVAVGGAVLALMLAWPLGGNAGMLRRFFLSYLTAYVFVLTIALGALFFVMLQHVVRAGWSVNVRRVPEAMANTMPVLAVLSLPILFSFLIPGESGYPTLYPWAAHHHEEADDAGQDGFAQAGGRPRLEESAANEEVQLQAAKEDPSAEAITVARARHHLHYDELTEAKSAYLNRPFFIVRLAFYFAVWIVLAAFYWRNSVAQDASGDPALTLKMQKFAPIGLLLFALTVTGASFDLVMSLDPHFFSTIFGVYLFSGGVVGFFAVTILAYQVLQMGGMLRLSVTREHYHDLGKFLFAFTFFWGYVAFSQFMLIYYANIPETTYWFGVRGATTVQDNLYWGAWPANPELPAGFAYWTVVAAALLFGHLLIPFAGLLSRHIKRSKVLLGFWAGWMLFFHYVDVYWIIMPELLVGGWALLPVVELGCLLAVSGVVTAYFLVTLRRAKLRPAADPRVHESLAFHNI